jgi:hypothetical protein
VISTSGTNLGNKFLVELTIFSGYLPLFLNLGDMFDIHTNKNNGIKMFDVCTYFLRQNGQ